MENIILSPIPVPELVQLIANEVQAVMNQKEKRQKIEEDDLLLSKEVCKDYKISYTTRHEWTKKGLLIAYKIGHKLYYKRSEVEQALTKLRR